MCEAGGVGWMGWDLGVWPSKRPVRRAARWDGVAPIFNSVEDNQWSRPTTDLVRELADYAMQDRTSDTPPDIAIAGDSRQATKFAETGSTCWRDTSTPEVGVDHDEWMAAVLNGPSSESHASEYRWRIEVHVPKCGSSSGIRSRRRNRPARCRSLTAMPSTTRRSLMPRRRSGGVNPTTAANHP
jgi:hypothetical protein